MRDKERLMSLDAFRGFTIAAMIMVNNPGSWSHVYAPLLHKPWHGITVTDLIFPFFLFIVGVSIALAYTKRVEAGIPKGDMYKKIIWRSVKIFAVGIFLSLYPKFNFEELRVAGVLQRIAIVFLVCAILFLSVRWKKQATIGVALLILYWLAMVLIPIPGYGKPMLEPGINLSAWIDSYLLPGRMWQKTWDPEGLFSTLPAIATGITGMLTGTLIVSKKTREEKIIWMFTAGFIALAIGHVWSWQFPLNKNIWTSSFVMVTSGLAALTLATSMYLVDVVGYRKIAHPGVVFGSNAITVYVLAGVFGYLFSGLPMGGASLNVHFMNFLTGLGFEPKFSSFLFAFLYIGLFYIPAWVMHKKKIFIKL
jgi:predicted acyltransferase